MEIAPRRLQLFAYTANEQESDMATDVDPVTGEWYINENDGERFQVVGLDDEQDMVEIMHYNGNLEEFPLQEWYQLSVVPGEQPMDVAAPTDDADNSESLDYPVDDPVAAKLPSDEDSYRRSNVEYANKAAEGYPGDKSEADEQGWGRDQALDRLRDRGSEQ
jgi:hypothetical protein